MYVYQLAMICIQCLHDADLGLIEKYFPNNRDDTDLDEFDKASGISRTCEQSVAVNKCEGACASSLRPSALNSNGFSKVKPVGVSG